MNNEFLISKGKELLGDSNHLTRFSYFDKVYPITTENIKETYQYFDLKDKDILTVTSSGDHIFCAALKGSKNIDCFDVNILTEYFYFLKKAFIETYDFNNFKNNFVDFIKGKIDVIRCDEVLANIPEQYQVFWNEIIKYSFANNLSLNNLFIANEKGFRLNHNTVNYLSLENYNLLKEKLPNVNTNFINSNLETLSGRICKKYDYIFLSNICDYVGLSKTKTIAKTKLMKHLHNDGKIIYAYIYETVKIPYLDYEDDLYMIENEKYSDYILTLSKGKHYE